MPQDYDKIFASGATSTQDWTDENYLRGWGYLGQTPPPYQLFDALFKRLDLKTQELKSGQDNISSNYVPLAGGVMTGLLSLFTGSTVPTPGSDDNSQKIVNSEWVQTWVKALVAELAENIEVQWSSSTFTCEALGITGLMAQNGYISLGKLFGGLILQWGYCSFNTIYQETEQQQIIVMPVVANTRIPIGVINCGNVEYWSQASPSLNINSSNLRVWNKGTQNQPIPAGLQIRWIFLCF